MCVPSIIGRHQRRLVAGGIERSRHPAPACGPRHIEAVEPAGAAGIVDDILRQQSCLAGRMRRSGSPSAPYPAASNRVTVLLPSPPTTVRDVTRAEGVVGEKPVGELELLDLRYRVRAVRQAGAQVRDRESLRGTIVSDRVIGVVAGEHGGVEIRTAVQHVVAGAAVQRVVVVGAARRRVVAAATIDRIRSGVAEQMVVAVAGGHQDGVQAKRSPRKSRT